MWASAGLLRDDVSSTVLTLNLCGTPALDWMADGGDPSVLALRQLAHRPPRTAPPVVHICETVLAAAADAHGPDARPLVCLQGQPSAAALTLLKHLHALGATFRYHGDFDWGGLRIAATLLRHVPWQPWRYTADDYREAAAAPGTGSRRLAGKPAASPWNPGLALALAEHGMRIEEAVFDVLVADLAGGGCVSGRDARLALGPGTSPFAEPVERL